MNAEQTIRQIHEVIGRVSLQTTHLQLIAASIASAGLGWSTERMTEALSKPGRKERDALKQLMREVPPNPLGHEIELFIDDMDKCLDERNRIVHSIVLLRPSSGGLRPEAWHPRTEALVPFFEGLGNLEDRLRAVESRGIRLGLKVQTWRDSQDSNG